MANRMLRDCTGSEAINTLTAHAEVFFYRLIMKADDFGSFYANPKLLKSYCYPFKSDTIRDADISRWIEELEKAGLIVVYTIAGKKYLNIKDFGQRLRTKNRKFPGPPEPPVDNPPQSAAIRRESPPEVEDELEVELEEEGEVELHPQKIDFVSTPKYPQNHFDMMQYEIQNAIEFIYRLKQKNLTADRINQMWAAFELNNFSGEKYYRSRSDIMQHFMNWLKNQKLDGNKHSGGTGEKPVPQINTSGDFGRL